MFKRNVPLWVLLSSAIIVSFCSYQTGAYLVTSSKPTAPNVEIPKDGNVGTNTQLVIASTQATLNTIQPLKTFVPSNTPNPTYTPGSTQTPWVIVVTVTSTSTPKQTATASNTPKPSPTVNPELTTDKTEGTWLVGKEVALGKWRASGDCYARLYDQNGDFMTQVDGPRSIIVVTNEAYTVKFISFPDHCTWSYLGR
jgi:hypothetical protein